MNLKVIVLLSIIFLVFSSKVVTDSMTGFLPLRFGEKDVIVLLIKTVVFALATGLILYFYKIDRNIIRVPYTQVKVNKNDENNETPKPSPDRDEL